MHDGTMNSKPESFSTPTSYFDPLPPLASGSDSYRTQQRRARSGGASSSRKLTFFGAYMSPKAVNLKKLVRLDHQVLVDDRFRRLGAPGKASG